MKRTGLPDRKHLLECFDYDPEIGVLFWKVRPIEHFADARAQRTWNKRFAAKAAGRTHRDGRRDVGISNGRFYVHRIIWKIMTDDDPPYDIDHKDGNPLNNKFRNLRMATRTQNTHNKKVHSNSHAGLKGVATYKKTGKFGASIQIHGERHFLGVFTTKEEAHDAYCSAAQSAFGEYWHDGSR